MKFRDASHCVLGSRFAIVSIAALWLAPFALAGNTWDGGGSDDNWGNGNNWSPDGSPGPGSGNDLFFAGSTRLTPFNNYTAFDDWRNITFNSGAASFNITGNAIDLFGKIENLSANGQTVGFASIALNSATANEFNPVNGNLTISSTNIFNNGNQLKVFGSNGFQLIFASGSNIQNAGSLAINQNSTVVFNSAHSYTGDTFVNAGKLQFNSGGSANSSIIRIGDTVAGPASAGVVLAASAGGQTLSNTVVSRAGSSGTRSFDSQNVMGTNTITGVVSLDAPLTVLQSGAGNLTFSGSNFIDVKAQQFTADVASGGTININYGLNSSLGAGGTLVKSGLGTLSLGSTGNTYTGTNSGSLNANGTRINAGTLAIAGATSLGIAPAGAYNNLQFTGSGTLRFDGANTTLGTTRNINVASGATATFNTGANVARIDGILNGSNGSVTKTGNGTLTLGGANTYTGATTVAQGTLTLATTGSISQSTVIDVQTSATLDVSAVSGGVFVVGMTQTLKGNGTITGNTRIDGTLSPGASNGKLTFSSASLTLSNSAVTNMEVSNMNAVRGSGYDAVDANQGQLSYEGALNVAFDTNYVYSAGNAWDLFNSAAVGSTDFNGIQITGAYSGILNSTGSGNWSNTIGGLVFTFTGSSGILSLSAQAVPEPLTAAGVILLAGRVLGRRARVSL